MKKERMRHLAQAKKRSKAPAVIVGLILVISLSVGGFAGYKLWEQNQVYVIGDAVYDEISGLVITHDQPASANSLLEIPSVDIDWPALTKINNSSIAWLYCPDTVIDYPVVAADDYDYYLHHLINGDYNANGTLFLDYNNSSDFSGKMSTIYGHHMQSGKMFGTLVGYKQQSYYVDHPYMYLYTEAQNYRIALKYGFVISADEWTNAGYMLDENADKLLEYAKANTTFDSAVQITETDRLIALSTCSYEFDEARYVVVGVLEPDRAT